MEDSNQNQPQTHNPGSWQPPMPEQHLQAAETQPAYVPQTTAYEAMQPTAASQGASSFLLLLQVAHNYCRAPLYPAFSRSQLNHLVHPPQFRFILS